MRLVHQKLVQGYVDPTYTILATLIPHVQFVAIFTKPYQLGPSMPVQGYVDPHAQILATLVPQVPIVAIYTKPCEFSSSKAEPENKAHVYFHRPSYSWRIVSAT
jgi:hypothetical protein